MPRTCSICNHKQRLGIEAALLDGESYRSIAKRFEAGEASILRHKNDGHVAQKLVKAQEAKEEAEASSLLSRLRDLNRETAAILADAKASKDSRLALLALARVEKQIELEGKLLGELGDGARDGGITFNLNVTEYRMPESASPINGHRVTPAHAEPVPRKAERVGNHEIPTGLQRYEIDPEWVRGSNGR